MCVGMLAIECIQRSEVRVESVLFLHLYMIDRMARQAS